MAVSEEEFAEGFAQFGQQRRRQRQPPEGGTPLGRHARELGPFVARGPFVAVQGLGEAALLGLRSILGMAASMAAPESRQTLRDVAAAVPQEFPLIPFVNRQAQRLGLPQLPAESPQTVSGQVAEAIGAGLVPLPGAGPLASQAVLGPVSAVGGLLGMKGAEQTFGPSAEAHVGGALAGSLAGPPSTFLPRFVGRQVGRLLPGAQRRAVQRETEALMGSRVPPDPTSLRQEAARAEELMRQVQGLELRLPETGPEFQAPFQVLRREVPGMERATQERLTRSGQAVRGFAERQAPTGDVEDVRRAFQPPRGALEDAFQRVTDEVGEVPTLSGVGGDIRNALEDALVSERSRLAEPFRRFDRSLSGPTKPLKDAVQTIRRGARKAEMDVTTNPQTGTRSVALDPESFPLEVMRRARRLQDTESLQELRAFRTRLFLEGLRESAKAVPNRDRLRRITALQQASDEAMKAAIATAPPEAQASLQQASNEFKALRDLFNRGVFARVTQGGARGEEAALGDSAIANLFVNAPRGEVQVNIARLQRALGEEQANALVRRAALSDLVRKAGTEGGPNPAAVRRWAQAHRDVLAVTPGLRQDLDDLVKTAQQADVATQAKQVESAAAQALLKADPRKAARVLLEGRPSPGAAREVRRLLQGNVAAEQGFTRALYDEALRQAGFEGLNTSSQLGTQLTTLLDRHGTLLQSFLGDEAMRTLRTVAQASVMLERSAGAQLPTFTAPTNLIQRVMAVMAARAGIAGGRGITAESLALRVANRLTKLSEPQQRAVMEGLLLSPSLQASLDRAIAAGRPDIGILRALGNYLQTQGLRAAIPVFQQAERDLPIPDPAAITMLPQEAVANEPTEAQLLEEARTRIAGFAPAQRQRLAAIRQRKGEGRLDELLTFFEEAFAVNEAPTDAARLRRERLAATAAMLSGGMPTAPLQPGTRLQAPPTR